MAVAVERVRASPLVKEGSILSLPSASPSSSVDSIYTFRKPSNFSTSPTATKYSFRPDMVMVAVVFSSSASLICEAMVRFQINSYNRFSWADELISW